MFYSIAETDRGFEPRTCGLRNRFRPLLTIFQNTFAHLESIWVEALKEKEMRKKEEMARKNFVTEMHVLALVFSAGVLGLAGCGGGGTTDAQEDNITDQDLSGEDGLLPDQDTVDLQPDSELTVDDVPAEDCDNGLDDDGNGQWDCDDAACQEELYCRPEDFAHIVDYSAEGNTSVSIVVASDVREREPRLLRIMLDGLPLSLEESEFLNASLYEETGFGSGVTAGVHRFTLNVDGEPVWDFGDVEFEEGLHQNLIAFGGLDDPATLTFEQPSGLGPDEVVVRMVNVWDTREPLDVLLCPSGPLEGCTTVKEDLAYGEVWESMVDRTDELHLGWERPPPPDYSLDRYIGISSSPAGQVFCVQDLSGPRTVVTTMLMMLPLLVSLDPDCYGCTGGFEINEPFPIDLMTRVQGACE